MSHQISHHTKQSELERLGIGIVSQIPIDPMHLVDLGVVRKMLLTFVESKSAKSVATANRISELLIDYKKYNPSEFQRSPRSLNEVVQKRLSFDNFFCILVSYV